MSTVHTEMGKFIQQSEAVGVVTAIELYPLAVLGMLLQGPRITPEKILKNAEFIQCSYLNDSLRLGHLHGEIGFISNFAD